MLGWVKSFTIFWYVLVCDAYIMWLKQFKSLKVPIVVGSIVLVSALTYCALLHFMFDLKASQINEQHSLIQKLMFYKFKLGHNAAEATENICCMKSEDEVDHNTVTKQFKKFCLAYKNLEDQVGLKL